MTQLTRLLAFLLLLTLPHLSHAKERVTLFAAASLTQPLEKVIRAFEQQSNVKVIASYASSSTLARQIYQGAPANIFISANQKWMNYLAENQQLDGSSQALLGNRLALVVPVDSTIQPATDIQQIPFSNYLSTRARLALGDPDHVPLGIYSKQALINLKLWQKVSAFLAPSNNARASLALVERGEVSLGISYLTDVKNNSGVKLISIIPEASHEPIRYSLATVANHQTSASQELKRFLNSSTAREVFSEFGFTTLQESPSR